MYNTIKYILILIFLSLFFLSCVNVDIELKFYSDLSGKADIHYWLITGSTLEGKIGIPISESEIVEKYGEIDGIKLEEVVVENKDGETHCNLNFTFERFNNLLKGDVLQLSEESFIEKNEDGNFEFLGIIEGKKMGLGLFFGMLKSFSFTLKVEMPGRIIETNGEKCGWNSVKWEYSLFELVNNPRTELRVISTSGGIFSLLFTYHGLPFIVIIMVVIIILIVVVLIMRYKRSH